MIILGDSYSKIKVFNADLFDEIFWIWVPCEGFLKQVVEVGDWLYFLFKKFTEHVIGNETVGRSILRDLSGDKGRRFPSRPLICERISPV